jgi:hypothetical protein
MTSNIKKFSIDELPIAYFNDNKKSNELRNEMIKNQVRISECQQSSLETYFFSDENMDYINKQIILSVYKNTNKKFRINNQSKEKLLIVMRYIFLEYARHLPYDIKKQILDLNCRVVQDIIPNIITNLNQKIDYLNEINNPRKLIPLPINVNHNNKTLQSVTNVFNKLPSNLIEDKPIPGAKGPNTSKYNNSPYMIFDELPKD